MTSTAAVAQPDDIASTLSDEFVLPTNKAVGASQITGNDADRSCIYLAGNSLGALSKRSKAFLQEEISVWGTLGVEGHFNHPHGREWVKMQDLATPLLAELVGAQEKEVACMSTLTTNLHLMMNTFYKPTSDRFKILCEAKAFPSDQYAIASQVHLHGHDLKEAIIELSPRPGEFTLKPDDILNFIAKEGSSIALVLFSGIQYYTGQLFPMESITRAAKEQGCICGWDLAHAIGNVPLALHDWGVDFAVWCSYKYLNSGPGGIGGLFIHEKWNDKVTQYAGWWGHDPATRFAMPSTFSAIPGAQGYQQSNASVLAMAPLLGSLQIFNEVGMMPAVRERSLKLTGYLEMRLVQSAFYVPLGEVATKYPRGSASASTNPGFTIITPNDPEFRGAQLSLLFLPTGSEVMRRVFKGLSSYGVIGDEREPDVIRMAPTPLYTSIDDCERAATYLEAVLRGLEPNQA